MTAFNYLVATVVLSSGNMLQRCYCGRRTLYRRIVHAPWSHSCVMRHRSLSPQTCGQQSVLTWIQLTTRFGVSCGSACTRRRYVMSFSWSIVWLKCGPETNRTLSKRRLTSDANDFVPVFEPMEYTLSISCDFCLMRICEIKFWLLFSNLVTFTKQSLGQFTVGN